jgi:LacI family transcriptional regulator
MAAKKSISMQMIADELGISKVTVSKALNGKDGVGDELREKIETTARRLGYAIPVINKKEHKNAAIIMSSRFKTMEDSGTFFMGMCEKIMTGLRKAGCSGIILTPDK